MSLWSFTAECVHDRTDVQCLHHWQKVLNPSLVKGPWTKEVKIKLYLFFLLLEEFFYFIYHATMTFISLICISRKMILFVSLSESRRGKNGLR